MDRRKEDRTTTPGDVGGFGYRDYEYRRMEADFLRGPPDKDFKLRNPTVNYFYWAECFTHQLSILCDMPAMRKLNALLAHTTGEAKTVVSGFQTFKRASRAKKQFETP